MNAKEEHMREVSAGAIVYTLINKEINYLLIKDFHGNYGFPKGHLENDETEQMAAVREIKEETGIDITLDPSFREELNYVMPNGIDKTSIYFIGYYENQTPIKQPEEVDEILILPYGQAKDIITFDNMKEALTKADAYLRKRSMKKEELLQSIKFTLFSISAGIIQISSFALFNDVIKMGWWPSYLISLILSVLWNFTLNRKFTFKSASNVPMAMFKVFVYYLIITPLSTIFGNYLTGTLHMNDYLVTGIDMLINLITEFLYQKYYVFKDSLEK